MIELRDVNIVAGGFSLHRISVIFPPGRYVVLMGQTGIGKTTLLEAICGLRPVRSGEIFLNGEKRTHASPAAREIGYVPQDLALFPTMTVREHLEFALRLRNWSKSDIRERVRELGELLQIQTILDRNVRNLSGGESQRVALGRALSFRPDILVLDEPFSALDESTRGSLQQLLKQIQSAMPMTVLHVTHSMDEALMMADHLFILEGSRIAEQDVRSPQLDERGT